MWRGLPLLLALPVACWWPGPVESADHTLYVSQCIPEDGLCSAVQVMRYRFMAGQLTETALLHRFEASQVRFALGENRIVNNRFVVTSSGDVIDLVKGRLLHDGTGILLGIDNGRAVLKVQQRSGKGIHVYDLTTLQYHRLEDPGHWALPGVISPDGTRSLTTSWWHEGELRLHRLEGTPQAISLPMSVQLDPRSSAPGSVPILWLDSRRVLTQESNGVLVILDPEQAALPSTGRDPDETTGTAVQRVLTIPIEEQPALSPELSFGPESQVLYHCGSGVYQIDVDSRTYQRLTWLPLGHGFAVELQPEPRRGLRIRYQGTTIGQYWCLPSALAVCAGHLALPYGEVGSSYSYATGIAVWSADSGQWIEIKADLIDALVGWTASATEAAAVH